ncbi:unnamed protein product, partial [marine sediment metagenome]
MAKWTAARVNDCLGGFANQLDAIRFNLNDYHG